MLALVCGVWLVLSDVTLRAQQPPAQPSGQGSAADTIEMPSPAAVRRAELDTFMVPDKDGELIKFFDFPYEELLELYRIKHQLGQRGAQPRYSVQRLDVSGESRESHATLRVKLTVLLSTDRWVKVPLGLGGALPRGLSSQDAEGEQFLHFDEAAEAYVVWLRGVPKQQRTLTLDVFVPLVRLGNVAVLRLDTPRAVTSRWTLNVDMADAVARASEGATIESTKTTDDGRTVFTLLGNGGPTELAWRKADQQATGVPAVLEASGTILTRIDGRSAGTEARLTVRSFGSSFDHFRVRLPRGATLIGGGEPGYTLAPVRGDTAVSARDDEARLVDVKLDTQTSGPVEVRLVTQQSHNLADSDAPLELAGFEVIGAVRQFGHIAVEAVGPWQVLWVSQQNVRRVENLPEILRRDDVVAGFEYFRQPCRLAARVVPRQTRIRVEPQYVLLVGDEQTRLQAKLKYTVHGAQIFAFDIDLRGWEWDIEEDDIGPENLVDVDAVTIDSQGILHIPLHQPSTAPVELLFEAHFDTSADAQSLELPLPVPEATSLMPASVAVLPDDNVELTESLEDMVGLVAQQIAPQMALPARQQVPLYYRADLDQATFAATIKVHPQSIAVDVFSQIDVNEQGGHVNVTLAYHVSHEPVNSLELDVPRTVADAGNLEISFEGTSLSPVEVGGGILSFDVDRPLLMRVDLPEPQIGRFELHIQYPLAVWRSISEQSTPLAVPLVMPADAALGTNEAVVKTTSAITVGQSGDVWTKPNDTTTSGPPGHELHLATDGRQSQLPLVAELVERHTPSSTIVERAWLQTWLTRSARQDRAVYRLTTSRRQLEIALPAGVDAAGVEVKLDGQPIPVETYFSEDGDEEGILIRLSETESSDRHQLELRYDVPQGGARPGWLALEPPRLGNVRMRHVYWQLLLPRDLHLVNVPSQFTPEYVWDWSGLYWGRRATMEQQELETWSGATVGTPAPAMANRYLFSSLGGTRHLSFRTASRASIVLAAAGAVLVVGLLLIYIPASRQPGILFAGCVVLLAMGIWYPEPTLLLAQAATLGLVLTLLAGLLRLITSPRRPSGVLARSSASSRSGFTPATEVYNTARAAQQPASSGPSTASTTISLQTMDPDS